MDKKELRIGNWVLHNDNWSYRNPLVLKGFPFQWEDRDWYALGECTLDLEDCSPIPLTDEILKKCGFKYGMAKGITRFTDDINDQDEEEDTYYWDFTIKKTELIDQHSISLVKWGKQEYFTFQLERGFYRQKIKYLHQLQNLYYSLTQTELQINL